jgi:hypothetical protein
MQATPFFDALQSARWQEAVAAPLAELNLQVIEAVVAWSGSPARAGSLGWLWRAMGPEARARAAGCRFLLLDLGLARPELWLPATAPGVPAAAGAPVAALASLHLSLHPPLLQPAPAAPAPVAPGPLLEPGLLRRALVYAWHLTRAHHQPARVTLGMSPAAGEALAACSLTELERLAERRPQHLRPRWLEHAHFWPGWLEASAQGRRGELEKLQFWGLQRLAADVLTRPP